MSETEDQTLQRICGEVEAEMGYKVFGFSSPDEVTADFAKAVARRYAATVGAGVPEGWRRITDADRSEARRTRLLIAQYPQSNGWSDVYSGWWDAKDQRWTRWPHEFPPTHCMDVAVPSP